MSLHARLSQLEKRYGVAGDRCPQCPESALVCLFWRDGPNGELLPTGETSPDPCTACGRPADYVELTEIVVASTET